MTFRQFDLGLLLLALELGVVNYDPQRVRWTFRRGRRKRTAGSRAPDGRERDWTDLVNALGRKQLMRAMRSHPACDEPGWAANPQRPQPGFSAFTPRDLPPMRAQPPRQIAGTSGARR